MLSLLLYLPLTHAVAFGQLLESSEIASSETQRSCEVDSRGDDLLVLVNKSDEHRLPAHWAPDDLVPLADEAMIPGREGMLRDAAASALDAMLNAAEQEGHDIRVRSAYRSFRRQKRVFRAKRRKYGAHKARRLSAEPGHSQHQLGTTVDLSISRFRWKFSQRLPRVAEGQWLARHAYRFGFVLSYPRGQEKLTGYAHEPWHYRYIGEAAARELREAELPLEQYLRACRQCDASVSCPTELESQESAWGELQANVLGLMESLQAYGAG